MPGIRHFTFAPVAIFCLLSVSAQAQMPAVSTVNVTPDADEVRISAVGDVLDMRVVVSDEAGAVVFEGAPTDGIQMSWALLDSQGRRAPAGNYALTVTYRTSDGKRRRRVEQVLIAGGPASETKQEAQTPLPGRASRGRGHRRPDQ